MSDIYGGLVEHPELPIEDPGRFTVEIKFHEFVARGRDKYDRNFCHRCGFNRVTPVHPKEEKDGR